MIADIRSRLPLSFGDEDSAALYLKQVARARDEGARLGRSFIVAPLCRVEVRRGVWLDAGAEVKLDAFLDGEVPAHLALRKLLESGRVIATGFEAGDDGDEPPRAA